MRTNLDYRSPPGHVCSPMPTRDGCIDWLGRVGTRLWVWPPVGPFPVTPDCCSDLCCPLRWWPGWWQGRRVGSGQPVLLAAAAAENPAEPPAAPVGNDKRGMDRPGSCSRPKHWKKSPAVALSTSASATSSSMISPRTLVSGSSSLSLQVQPGRPPHGADSLHPRLL